jgi:hypothetical protein
MHPAATAGPAIIPAIRACGGLECGLLADLLVMPTARPRGAATKKIHGHHRT